jgi:hypothetical protein
MLTTWNAETSDSEAARRAGGRRRYNQMRQAKAARRLGRIIDIMARNRWHSRQWGIRAKIARELGVSRATICRDLQHLERSLDSPSYADVWLRLYRKDRRTNGDCFGPRPGRVFPQMDHSQKRMLRVAMGLGPRKPNSSARSPRGSYKAFDDRNEHTCPDLASLPEQPATSLVDVDGTANNSPARPSKPRPAPGKSAACKGTSFTSDDVTAFIAELATDPKLSASDVRAKVIEETGVVLSVQKIAELVREAKVAASERAPAAV